MADENKNYTSKLKIGNAIYHLKDLDAQQKLSVLNGAKGVAGSVVTTVYEQAKDAEYATKYTYTEGSGTPQVGDYVLDNEEYVEVTLANLSTYAESTPYTRTEEVTTIEQAIQDAAASIGNLTVNGVAPDSNDAIVIDASDIKRDGENVTIESSLSTLETAVATLNDDDTVEGSVAYAVKNDAVTGIYSNAIPATYTAATEYNSETTYYSDDQGTVANPQPTDQDDITQYYVVNTPAVAEKTIGQAIAANTTAIGGIDTRVTSLEGTRTTLLGNDTVTGSIDNRIKTQAGDATTQLTAGGENTTITAAIQSLQSQVNNTNKGQFRVIEAVDQANKTITYEDGDEPTAVSLSDLGYIYLVESNSADTKSVYTEYIVTNLGTDADPDLIIEKIGDTDLSLTGYATESWVTANAKNATYSAATEAVYVAATEYDSDTTYYSDDTGTVADPQPDSTSTISNYYVLQTPAVAAKTIAQAIAANTSAISDEVTRATTAEGALDNAIDTLDASVVKTVNNVGLDTGTNNVTIDSTNINHTSTTSTDSYSAASSATFAGDTLYKLVDDEYVEVPQADWETEEQNGNTLYAKTTTTSSTTVTVSAAIESLKTSVATETSRATTAEEALAGDIAALQSQVNGSTVTSVNGKAATAQNHGAVTITAADVDYKEASTDTYVQIGSSNDSDFVDSTLDGYIADGSETYLTENTLYFYSNNAWKSVTLKSNGKATSDINGTAVTDSNVLSELASVTTGDVYIKNVQSEAVTVEDAFDNLYSRFESMTGTTGDALTSVSIKSGTGVWTVDSVDNEQLNWTDIELETSDATFLAPYTESTGN